MKNDIRSVTGVVLAAGFGSRLASNGVEPVRKPLVSIHGDPLVIRAIRSLESAGCNRIVIVVGYESDAVRDAVVSGYLGNAEIIFAQNDRYDLKNGVSVLAADPFIDSDFILMMADHIVDEAVMEHARLYRPQDGTAALLVDYKIDSIFDLADATKVIEEEGRIVSVGKNLLHYNCVDTGVFICTQGLIDALRGLYTLNGDVSLSEGVQALADLGRMYTIDIGSGFWQDVDTPEMLEYVTKKLDQEQDRM